MASYVDVTGIPDQLLEFLGYILVDEDENYQYFVSKGEEHILPKSGRRRLKVDDDNDAAILRSRHRIPLPPRPPGAAKPSPKAPIRPKLKPPRPKAKSRPKGK